MSKGVGVSSLVLALLAVGCGDDSGDSSREDAGTGERLRSLTFRLEDFAPHVGQEVHIAVVGAETERLYLHAVVDTLTESELELRFRQFLPEGDEALVSLYADFDEDGAYSNPPADHTWQYPIGDSGDAVLEVRHNLDFVDFGGIRGVLATVDLEGFGEHVGRPVRLSLYDDRGRLVGLYRSSDLATESSDLRLVVQAGGVSYRAELWVDVDGDDAYDSSVDASWVADLSADSAPTATVNGADAQTALTL